MSTETQTSGSANDSSGTIDRLAAVEVRDGLAGIGAGTIVFLVSIIAQTPSATASGGSMWVYGSFAVMVVGALLTLLGVVNFTRKRLGA